MLVSEAMTIARRHLQDLETPYRYEDGDLIAAANAGLAMAYRLRPDLFIGAYTGAPPQVAVTTDVIPLDGLMTNALADYMASWAEIKDDEFTTDGRAEALRRNFIAALAGSG